MVSRAAFPRGGRRRGLVALGIRTHQQADDDFQALASYSRSQGLCELAEHGRYTDRVPEVCYWDIVGGARAARAYLLGAQAALVGSVVMFVLELKRGRGTRNIPYSGLIVRPGRFGTRVGVRIAW